MSIVDGRAQRIIAVILKGIFSSDYDFVCTLRLSSASLIYVPFRRAEAEDSPRWRRGGRHAADGRTDGRGHKSPRSRLMDCRFRSSELIFPRPRPHPSQEEERE